MDIEEMSIEELRENYRRLKKDFEQLSKDYKDYHSIFDRQKHETWQALRAKTILEEQLDLHIPNWRELLSFRQAGIKPKVKEV